MPTACRSRPVRATGSPNAGSRWTKVDAGWTPQREPVRSLATAIEDSLLRVERTEAAVPDGAADLVTDLYRRMPDARITDILLEVDAATRFTEAFTHLRTGSPCRDRIGLLNVLLAEGINLGLRKMAEATTTHGFWELMRIARWHVEGEAYDRALSVVVEAQAGLPIAAFWGSGRTASSDGQFFPAGGRGEALNDLGVDIVNSRLSSRPFHGGVAIERTADRDVGVCGIRVGGGSGRAPLVRGSSGRGRSVHHLECSRRVRRVGGGTHSGSLVLAGTDY